jgi:hypothetical protein
LEKALYKEGVLFDNETINILSDAPPAMSYELIPSVSMIFRDASGAAHPSVITCSQQVKIGSNPPTISNMTIKYITSVSETEIDYSGSVAIASDWTWIKFLLYDGSALLDYETIFIAKQ